MHIIMISESFHPMVGGEKLSYTMTIAPNGAGAEFTIAIDRVAYEKIRSALSSSEPSVPSQLDAPPLPPDWRELGFDRSSRPEALPNETVGVPSDDTVRRLRAVLEDGQAGLGTLADPQTVLSEAGFFQKPAEVVATPAVAEENMAVEFMSFSGEPDGDEDCFSEELLAEDDVGQV